MGTPRWTTPIKTLKVPANLTGCTVVVTIDQDGTQISKSNYTSSDVQVTIKYKEDGTFDYSEIAVGLSQADTGKFEVGKARIQVTYLDVYGNAEKTEIQSIEFDESLLNREVTYGE